MSQRYNLESRSMKEPMFDLVRAMLGETMFKRFMLDYDDRTQKESPQEYLGGKSPRQFMIWISESVIKPQFGKRHLGNLAAEKLKVEKSTAIFSDGGFPDEVEAIVEAGFKVKLIRLHRDGFTFDGDSRDYIHIPHLLGGWNYAEKDVTLCDGEIYHGVNHVYRAAFG
jgi:hypothetical protein